MNTLRVGWTRTSHPAKDFVDELRAFARSVRAARPRSEAAGGVPPPLDGIPALCYHSITGSKAAEDPFGLDVRPRAFDRQMAWLASHGLRGLALDDLFPDGSEGDRKPVAVTFDDGYDTVASEALPILSRHGFVGSVFVVVDRVGKASAWEEERGLRTRSFMGWGEVRHLLGLGWTVGSHTMTHRSLVGVSDEELEYQLVESKRAIEDAIGRGVRFVSYPYGHVDARVAAAAKRAGYAFGVALDVDKSTRMAVRRGTVLRSTGMWTFRVKMSRLRKRT